MWSRTERPEKTQAASFARQHTVLLDNRQHFRRLPLSSHTRYWTIIVVIRTLVVLCVCTTNTLIPNDLLRPVLWRGGLGILLFHFKGTVLLSETRQKMNHVTVNRILDHVSEWDLDFVKCVEHT